LLDSWHSDGVQTIVDAITNSRGPSPVELAGADRGTLAYYFAACGFARGAEIGVEEGKYSEVLLRTIPGLTLYCVDPWLVYPGYRERLDQEHVDGLRASCIRRLAPWPVKFLELRSVDAARLVDDSSLDFVYIDGNHDLPNVIVDLTAWTPKVRKGGIIAGHDWIRMRDCVREPIHVQAAVEAWTKCYRIDPWFVLGLKSEKRPERARSWMWVNA